jgi:hypothetical protein
MVKYKLAPLPFIDFTFIIPRSLLRGMIKLKIVSISSPTFPLLVLVPAFTDLNLSRFFLAALLAALRFVEMMGNKTRLFGSRENECVSTLYARHDLIFHPGLPSSAPWAHLNRKTEGVFPDPLKRDSRELQELFARN